MAHRYTPSCCWKTKWSSAPQDIRDWSPFSLGPETLRQEYSTNTTRDNKEVAVEIRWNPLGTHTEALSVQAVSHITDRRINSHIFKQSLLPMLPYPIPISDRIVMIAPSLSTSAPHCLLGIYHWVYPSSQLKWFPLFVTHKALIGRMHFEWWQILTNRLSLLFEYRK